MASNDLLMALAPSVAGNIAALTLGVAHGSFGDMPRLGAKKDDKGNPILDKDGNQQGGVPYDALTAGLGYALGAGMTFFGKSGGTLQKYVAPVVTRVGDAGAFIYTYSWGGQMGQKSRKDAGKLTGTANSRTVTSGERDSAKGMGEGSPKQEAASSDPAAELARLYGVKSNATP